MNIFNESENYIDEISKKIHIKENSRKTFSGKTMAFLFLTKFCDVECSHCFFRSRKNLNNEESIEYEFSEEGLEKVIEFINKSNNGYLSVLGGGEPFNRFDYIIKLISKIKTDRLVLVTSGNWAKNKKEALEKITEMKKALKARQDNLKLVLRISVDKWHILKIGQESVLNIIDIMTKEMDDNFILELHTLTDDNSLEEIFKKIGNYEIRDYHRNISDNDDILKLGHARYNAVFKNGLKIKVGVAQKFNSNLKINLNNSVDDFDELIEYFDIDIEKNCFGNPSLVYDKYQEKGLDFLISYNGNICTWGNDQTYDLNNLYIHSYDEIIKRSVENIISYSFIDKGYQYREDIFNEVNPKAVIRSKAINIRDYAGASLFEERASVLYYGIRVLQDYLQEGIILKEDLNNLSDELINAILLSKEELIELYKQANYTILDQYIKNENYTVLEWKDLFELIRLGHYDISEDKIIEAINIFNFRFNENVKSIDEFKTFNEEQYVRLLNRLAGMDKKVFQNKI